jgi:hypothetical protein
MTVYLFDTVCRSLTLEIVSLHPTRVSTTLGDPGHIDGLDPIENVGQHVLTNSHPRITAELFNESLGLTACLGSQRQTGLLKLRRSLAR